MYQDTIKGRSFELVSRSPSYAHLLVGFHIPIIENFPGMAVACNFERRGIDSPLRYVPPDAATTSNMSCSVVRCSRVTFQLQT